MLATIVNCLAVVMGSLIGFFLQKGIPQKARQLIMEVLGLCTVVIGLKMAFQADNDVIVVLALAFGAVIGYVLKLDTRMNQLGLGIKKRMSSENGDFVEGFVTASLIICVGAMAILGAVEAGINKNYSILFTKSVLDFFLVIVLASSYGGGVIFSAAVLFIYQGLITLSAGFLAPFLTESVLAYLSASGGVLIMGLGLSLAGIREFQTINLLPGVFIAPFLAHFLLPFL